MHHACMKSLLVELKTPFHLFRFNILDARNKKSIKFMYLYIMRNVL